MIVGCPECQTRFRVDPTKVGPKGARMRCSKCETVFGIPAPVPAVEPVAASAPQAETTAPASPASESAAAPDRPLALIVESDPEAAKRIEQLLSDWGIQSEIVEDGSAALLMLFRKVPALAILGGHLPGVTAPVLCEVVRRAAELRAIKLIRVSTLDQPAGAPEFDADQTLEPADLPEGLAPLLEAVGVGSRPAPPPPPPEPPVVEPPEPVAADAADDASASPEEERRSGSLDRRQKLRKSRRPVSSDPDIAAAERLSRIIVSDIILYNEAKFAAGVKDGNVAEAVIPIRRSM